MSRNSLKGEISQKDLSLAEIAYQKIKEEILKNEFPSGEFISISELSKSLEGMGRTPVREAVQRLHDDRLLIVVPRKGIIIPEFDIKKMMDQLELRFILEKYATLKAADKFKEEMVQDYQDIITEMGSSQGKSAFQLANLNMKFHMRIVESLNNHELTQTISRIYDHHIRIYTYFLQDKMRLASTQEEHKEILSALQNKDKPKIEDAVNKHYENTRQELLNAIMT